MFLLPTAAMDAYQLDRMAHLVVDCSVNNSLKPYLFIPVCFNAVNIGGFCARTALDIVLIAPLLI